MPITGLRMPLEEADLIASTVLTRTYLKSVGKVTLARMCSCQYGTCGHCHDGRHDKCTTRVVFKGRPNPSPLARIVGRSGAALTAVWPAKGAVCRWICPCSTCAAEQPDELAKPREAAYRRATGAMRPGDTIWLTPKTLGCPSICWERPRVTIVALAGMYATVRLANSQEFRIHLDNLAARDPRERQPELPRRTRSPSYPPASPLRLSSELDRA